MQEVANTYLTWERKGKPFRDGNRAYIVVINPKTHKEKTVRWYGEIIPDYKHLLGFDNGYITIFKGVCANNWDFFSKSNARYAWFFGWYIPSTEEIPQLPSNVEPIKLEWQENFINADERLKAAKNLIGEIYDK